MNKPDYFKKIYKDWYLTEFDDIKYSLPWDIDFDEEYSDITYWDQLRYSLEFSNWRYFFITLLWYVWRKYNLLTIEDNYKQLDISLDYLLPILNKWLLKMKVSELWNRKWLHLKITKDTLKKVQWLKNFTDKEKEILINSPLQVYVQLDKLTKKEISSFVKDWATLTEMGYFYNPRMYKKETSQKWIEKVKKIWKNITNSNDRQTFEMFWVEITLLENVFESDYVNNK